MLQRLYAREPRYMPRRILFCVLGLLCVHVAEIWIFGLGYYALLHAADSGALAGADNLLDLVFFSAMVYTTVGFAEITPSGPIRFLTGMEALSGLALIAWSASFTYFQMHNYWRSNLD
ncbi:MAG: two pore domain potassium channel family protein [Gammaproteobacteria bacterium]|nr:two pore domain potassium channel family protein [Gammaproteobacteria bacterium]